MRLQNFLKPPCLEKSSQLTVPTTPSPFAPAHDTSVPDSRRALQAPTSLQAQQGRTGQTLGLCCDWHATSLPGQTPRPCSTARTWAITGSLAAARCPGAWMDRRSPQPTRCQPLNPYLALATFSATSPPPGTAPGTSWSPGGQKYQQSGCQRVSGKRQHTYAPGPELGATHPAPRPHNPKRGGGGGPRTLTGLPALLGPHT